MADFRIAVLGDSVSWGQGLLEPQKSYSLVAQAIQPAAGSTLTVLPPVVLAHSGAVIGVDTIDTEARVDGEVPRSFPSILEQCDAFEDPQDVDLVLLTGGINDVGVARILSPLTRDSDLRNATHRHCLHGMKTLLVRVAGTFTKPGTKIVVSSYYPILSHASHLPLVRDFLMCLGVFDIPFPLPGVSLTGGPVTLEIIEQCDIFWKESTFALRRAVEEVNANLGVPRVFFAPPAYTERNAALAPEAWLWGIHADLSPEDPMADQRQLACDVHEPNPLKSFTCRRASAGHPNVLGAQAYASAIRSILGIA